MASCEVLNCKKEGLYQIVVKKSDTDEAAHRVCEEHRNSYDVECKENGWEFIEIN